MAVPAGSTELRKTPTTTVFELEALEGLPCGCVAAAYRARPWDVWCRVARGQGSVLHPAGPRQRPDSASGRSRGIRRRRGSRRSRRQGRSSYPAAFASAHLLARCSASFSRLSHQHHRTFRFSVGASDPRHPVWTSSFAANITRHIAIGHPSIVYPASVSCVPRRS